MTETKTGSERELRMGVLFLPLKIALRISFMNSYSNDRGGKCYV